MFKNYLRIALQQIKRQPVYSAIKILSLTMGLAASVLVIMHVQYIQSFNKNIANWENTYRLVTHMMVRETNQPYRTMTTAEPYLPQLRLDYSDQLVRSAKIRGASALFNRMNNDASENNFYWAEPDIIEIFGLELLQGDPNSLLAEPNTMVISESVAQKYFGDDNAMGEILELGEVADIRVTGIYADQPQNVTHELEMLVSVPTARQIFGENFMAGNAWIGFNGTQTFLTFEDEVTAMQVNADLENFLDRNLPENSVTFGDQIGLGLSLQPVTDMYLNPLNNFGEVESSPRKTMLTGLLVFAGLILATSCINYINLSLAQISRRGKEIGIRKTIGANRGQIVSQFLLESLLFTFLALFISVPLIALALPVYTNLTDTYFEISHLFQTGLVLQAAGLAVLTGLLAGFAPALSIARLEPTQIMKDSAAGTRSGKISKAIVTSAQFAFSATLILLSIAIYVQTRHLQELDVGYDKDNLVILDSRFASEQPDAFNYEALLNDLRDHPAIASLAAAQNRPPGTGPINPWRLPSYAPDESITLAHTMVSPNYIETFGMRLLAGRTFQEDFATDFMPTDFGEIDEEQDYGIVVTDDMLRRFGLGSPDSAMGQRFLLGNINMHVIGVIQRFQFASGMESAERSVAALRATLDPLRFLLIRIDPTRTEQALAHIDAAWERHRPGIPLNREFFAQSFNEVIDSRTSGLSMAALMSSIITTIIAGFGLYALASYSSERRTKEVGIRKTLGATTEGIIGLLAWDFIKPVLVACVIAWPLAYLAIDNFYSNFTDRANFSVLFYLAVTVGIVGLALITVAVQCFRTANSDPVKSLRYE